MKTIVTLVFSMAIAAPALALNCEDFSTAIGNVAAKAGKYGDALTAANALYPNVSANERADIAAIADDFSKRIRLDLIAPIHRGLCNAHSKYGHVPRELLVEFGKNEYADMALKTCDRNLKKYSNLAECVSYFYEVSLDASMKVVQEKMRQQ